MVSSSKLKLLLPPLTPKEQKALAECGGYKRSIRHHDADVVIETRRCKQVALCRSCAVSSAALGLHSVRSNAEKIFAKNPKSKLYLLTLTLPPSALAESRQSVAALKDARAAVRKALGGLCIGDAWVVESVKIDSDITSEAAAHTHMHVMLHMHKSINSGRGYLSDAALKSLLDGAVGGGAVGYDLRHVKPRSWLSEAHQQSIMQFGYSNKSGYFAMYSYVFKSALDEVQQNGQDYYTAYRRQLKGARLRGSSGSLGGITKPVPFYAGLKPEAGEQVKERRRVGGGDVLLSSSFYDPAAEKDLRERRAAARRALKQAPQALSDAAAAKRAADDAAAASERKNAARIEKYHARKSVASVSLRDVFHAQSGDFVTTKQGDWIPAPALLKKSTAKAALWSLMSLFSSNTRVFVRRKYEIKRPRDDPSAKKNFRRKKILATSTKIF